MNEIGFYKKSDDDIVFVKVNITDNEGVEFDMDTLKEIFHKSISNNQSKLKPVIDFGAAITGDHYKGTAFMMGWVINKILTTYELKNDTKLKVDTIEEQIDLDEIKDQTVTIIEDLLTKIKSDEFDISDLSSIFSVMDPNYE